jgi:hypothetical protein
LANKGQFLGLSREKIYRFLCLAISANQFVQPRASSETYSCKKQRISALSREICKHFKQEKYLGKGRGEKDKHHP